MNYLFLFLIFMLSIAPLKGENDNLLISEENISYNTDEDVFNSQDYIFTPETDFVGEQTVLPAAVLPEKTEYPQIKYKELSINDFDLENEADAKDEIENIL